MTTPPADASLDTALALGGTRVATYAHPDCRCSKPKPALPGWTGSPDTYRATLAAFKAEHGSPREPYYRRRDCPVHVGTAGGA